MTYIVSGYYTPDYADCANRLTDSLDALNEPHHFFQADKRIGGWEANTMRKAHWLATAVRFYPNKTIIWLDVDCTARAPLAPLARVPGDIASFIKVKRSLTYIRIGMLSTLIVVKPTAGAKDFVRTWRLLTRYALRTDVDQITMSQALGLCHGTSFAPLSPDWCWPDHPDGPLAFYSASNQKALPKFKRWRRAIEFVAAKLSGAPVELKQIRPLLHPNNALGDRRFGKRQ